MKTIINCLPLTIPGLCVGILAGYATGEIAAQLVTLLIGLTQAVGILLYQKIPTRKITLKKFIGLLTSMWVFYLVFIME